MGFPEELYRLRRERGLSQKELAEALGVSQASIGYWEKGQRTPSIEAVQNISDYFGVSLEDMVSRRTGTIDLLSGIKALENIKKSYIHESPIFTDFSIDEYTEEELIQIYHFAKFLKSNRKK